MTPYTIYVFASLGDLQHFPYIISISQVVLIVYENMKISQLFP